LRNSDNRRRAGIARTVSANLLLRNGSKRRGFHPPKRRDAARRRVNRRRRRVPKFIIERNIPDLGKLSNGELRDVARKSIAVLKEMAPRVQWLRSFVTGDKMYCEYIAESAEAVREHARRGGFPANSVAEVKATVDPTSGE
jgi:hypothetical protein